jgi:hypothetical protein
MALVLTIATADMRRLAGIDAADTSYDTILAAVVTAEQPAAEVALDPTTLSGASGYLLSLLTLGVTEQLAGSYLQQKARAPIALGTLTIGTLVLTQPNATTLQRLGDSLVLKGTTRLAPYTPAGIRATATATNAAALAASKATTAAADAAARAELDAAKLAIAQGQAAKYAEDDTDDNFASLVGGSNSSAFDDCEASE